MKAGDYVKHGPSGEEWVLACDPEGGYVAPAGWPAGLAKESDCTVVREASEAERREMLERVAAMGPDNGVVDFRARMAQRQIAVRA